MDYTSTRSLIGTILRSDSRTERIELSYDRESGKIYAGTEEDTEITEPTYLAAIDHARRAWAGVWDLQLSAEAQEVLSVSQAPAGEGR